MLQSFSLELSHAEPIWAELSQLFKTLSSDYFTKHQQNDIKKIFANRFQYFIGMMITAKYRNNFDYQHNSCVSLEHCKQKIFESSNLLGPIKWQSVVWISLIWGADFFCSNFKNASWIGDIPSLIAKYIFDLGQEITLIKLVVKCVFQ